MHNYVGPGDPSAMDPGVSANRHTHVGLGPTRHVGHGSPHAKDPGESTGHTIMLGPGARTQKTPGCEKFRHLRGARGPVC
jgi:hypothetical protein